MRKYVDLILGTLLFVFLLVAVGCRLIGDYGNDSGIADPVAGTGGNMILSGKVALANDVDTGLLTGVRGVVASGPAVGTTLPVTGLKARLYSYSQGASTPVALPVDVSASGTFSFSVPAGSLDLFVRVFNSSETLVLLSVVNYPSAATPITVSEHTTAIGAVVLVASGKGKYLRAMDVESQIPAVSLAGIVSLIGTGLKDPVNGTQSAFRDLLVTTVAGTITSTGPANASTTDVSTWTASVLAGTLLNSPTLAALAGQYGQTSRTILDSLSGAELDKAVKAAFAVGVDLSKLDPAKAAADPLILAALRLGTPIVFENSTAVSSLLGGIPGSDAANAAAAMAAAVGVGAPSQISIVVPSFALTPNGVSQVFCLGAGAEIASLSPGVLSTGSGSMTPPTSTASKDLAPSVSTPPVTDAGQIVAMIRSAIQQGIRLRTLPLASIAADTSSSGMPAGITKKEFVFRFPEYVWYPRNRSQDFVIQCSVRVQMFSGSGGSKKWVRFIFDDAGDSPGFLNRGTLVFSTRTDKGYYMSGAQIKVTTDVNWVTFGDRSPGYADCTIENASQIVDPPPAWSESSTSFDVDYVENGVTRSWTSTEKRQFDMSEYELRTYTGVDFQWRIVAYDGGSSSEFGYRLDTERVNHFEGYTNERAEYDWSRMFSAAGDFEADNAHWPLRIARGTDQASLHPKVQAYYWVPSSETRTANFDINLWQEVWNTWSEVQWSESRFRNVYSANIGKSISINFGNSTANAPLWSTNTGGNPGARKVMQSDGNLVIYSSDGRALWGSGTGGTPGNPGAYVTMQSDGNLVIYSRKAIWSTNTPGNSGATKVFQNDGNLVIYSKDGKPLWASNTGGNPGATCRLQDDGNLVITSSDGRILWSSGTGGNNGATDVMQDDGNYVIYDHRALWSSGTAGNPGAYDVMQDDGNYVIYTRN